ncbi:DNA-binding transcriptional LysR family regulator [Neorhizobium huautlense]|uniref:DNA-binding transcriptional LysR family regulator n=1 Tax=Neorhizobium huautlense TaxID=67774 RepID=A0ABT9Q085_9HYPH|nr:LysR family transcriptional regulator [Neorhizobium huautlense]MDP9840136.1 DNA-binding transcriptional LysR family regulator [Neorhizobium huautlense]
MDHPFAEWKFLNNIRNMSTVNNLRGVDLNLLVVLDAVLAERHVSRASLRLGMSQPAVSHALARLRDMFDDPLLVRRDGTFVLTTRAQQLVPLLSDTLHQIRMVVGPEQFDPANEVRQFRIAMSDYGSAVLLPQLMPMLRHEAPAVSVVVTHSDRSGMVRQIMDGEVDLALGVFSESPTNFAGSVLFNERFVCVVADDADEGSGTLTMEAYLQRPHILVAMKEVGGNEIDVALAKLGFSRRIALALPHWSVAQNLVSGTDLILTIASRAVGPLGMSGNNIVLEPPFSIPEFSFTVNWHDRRTHDPAHQWFREVVRRAVGSNDPSRRL